MLSLNTVGSERLLVQVFRFWYVANRGVTVSVAILHTPIRFVDIVVLLIRAPYSFHNPLVMRLSYRQVGVPPADPCAVDRDADVGAHDGRVARKCGDSAEEVAEQDHDAVQLYAETNQGPPQQDQQQAAEEGRRALGLLLAGEEEEGLGWADDDGQADEEQDLLETWLDETCRRGRRGEEYR